MNLRIAVIETEHFEVLDPAIHLLLLAGAEIHVMSTNSVKQCSAFAESADVNWHTTNDQLSNRLQIEQLKASIQQLSINSILLLTVSNNHFFYSRLKTKTNTIILGIHDLNSYLIPQINFSIRGFVRYFSRKRMFQIADRYLVFSEKQVQILKAETKKQVDLLPPALFHSVQFTPKSYTAGQELIIVVPGSIDPKRRNYDEVFTFAQEAKKASIPVRLILLGAPPRNFQQSFKSKLTELEIEYSISIDYFDDHVPTAIFLEYLRKAHFIWAPVQQVFDNSGESWETYGVTKISGSVYDAIRVGRPLLLPDHYVTDPSLLKSTIFYRSVKDIVGVIKFVSEHPEQYAGYQLQALTASMNYVPEKWTDQIEKLIKP